MLIACLVVTRASQDGNTDIYCPMYPSHKKLEKYGKLYEDDARALPLIMVEYAHAMGNSLGAFKEYWDVIYKYGAAQLQTSSPQYTSLQPSQFTRSCRVASFGTGSIKAWTPRRMASEFGRLALTSGAKIPRRI